MAKFGPPGGREISGIFGTLFFKISGPRGAQVFGGVFHVLNAALRKSRGVREERVSRSYVYIKRPKIPVFGDTPKIGNFAQKFDKFREKSPKSVHQENVKFNQELVYRQSDTRILNFQCKIELDWGNRRFLTSHPISHGEPQFYRDRGRVGMGPPP